MKKTIILLFILLPLLSGYLFAQSQEGLFRLKEGDWFEVQFELKQGASYLLNYQLQKLLANNDQQFRIIMEHIEVKKKNGSIWIGYDSYYPAFEENRINSEGKNEFIIEISPKGKIVSLVPSVNNRSEINLTEIGSSYQGMYKLTQSESGSDSILVDTFSSILIRAALGEGNCPLISDYRVPLLIKAPDSQMTLTDTSFPVSKNAMIQGKVKDQSNKEIVISMIGKNSGYYFPEKKFHTKNDGSFTCPIFLKRPLHLRIQVGDSALTTFMEPGDTLNISAIGHQVRPIQYSQYADTKPNGYYSSDLSKSDYFTGSAAYNTMLSNELDQFRTGFPGNLEVQEVIKKREMIVQNINSIIESYKGKASKKCINYFQADFKYFLAVAKLYFKQEKIFSLMSDSRYQNKMLPDAQMLPDVQYPSDFFLEVDTIPLLMNSFEWNSSYQNFIQKSQQFKQDRLGWSVSKRRGTSFLQDYFFAQASLQGYPLYNQLAIFIDSELRKGMTDNEKITSYYQDFLNNCADPALTEPLRKNYETALKFQIGKYFPIKSFILQDSSQFNLEKLKGKPICLILLRGSVWYTKDFETSISKFNEDEVEFIFARLPIKGQKRRALESGMEGKPNVTFIDLAQSDDLPGIPEPGLIPESNLNWIFMLDKWFRIVENNAEDPMTHQYKGRISNFEKSLRKTIDTERYTKSEKTAMLKIAGWSFGSILFTFLIGIWIYRIRVRRIKQQETIKRRIKELEIKAIRSQMNPHFVFNALNSIQSLINGNQFKEANIYLSKFAVLLRGVLNNSEKSMVSLSDELKAVELYCQLEQLRFEFKFEINVNPEVNCDLIEIPGMIIQPLAENAIVHGLSPKGNQGKLSIQIERHNGDLCVGVSDNGVGLSPQVNDTLSQKGFGLRLVEERLNILNLDGKMAKLTIKNKDNEPGTFAKLTIPIE